LTDKKKQMFVVILLQTFKKLIPAIIIYFANGGLNNIFIKVCIK